MRPLQHWLHSRVPRWAWRRGTLRVGITQRAAAPLEQVSRHTVVPTDASSTGWRATCNGQAASGLWTGPRLLCTRLQGTSALAHLDVTYVTWDVFHIKCHMLSESGFTETYIYIQPVCSFCLAKNGPNLLALL